MTDQSSSRPRSRAPMRRRTFLAALSAGAVGLSLPFVQKLQGQPPVAPKRFIGLFTPNGILKTEWATGTGRGFELGRVLEPLAPFRDKLLVVDGLENGGRRIGPGSSHQCGAGCLLTGAPLLEGDFDAGGGHSAGWGSSISIDQYLANRLDPSTKLRSVQLGVGVAGSNNRHRISYAGSDQPLPPDDNPARVYRNFFADLAGGTAAFDRIRSERRSVIDHVRGELRSLNGALGLSDRPALEAHLESLRDIERGLDVRAECAAPTVEGLDADDFRNVSDLQIKILAAAFRCDLTRIATVLYSGATSNQTFPWLGIDEGHHRISHIKHMPDHGTVDGRARDRLRAIALWYAGEVAKLLNELETTPELDGSGTMLDNSIVFWGNELSDPYRHQYQDMRFVVAGRAGGYFDTGRRIVVGGDRSNNDLLVSFLNAMGLPDRSFGTDRLNRGPIEELR